MPPMEIERKFTVKALPENLDSYPFHLIEQAYLNTDPVLRIRRQDDEYYLTYKGKGLMAREEYNLPLNQSCLLYTSMPRPVITLPSTSAAPCVTKAPSSSFSMEGKLVAFLPFKYPRCPKIGGAAQIAATHLPAL